MENLDWSKLIADRQAQAALSDADFLTWAATKTVDATKPQQISPQTFVLYLQTNGLWPTLVAAAINSASPAFGVASSAKDYLADSRNAYVDFQSTMGQTLMQGLIQEGIFTQAQYDAAVLTFFGKSPNDGYGATVTQDHLTAIPSVSSILALESRQDKARAAIDVLWTQLLDGANPAIPAWADLGA